MQKSSILLRNVAMTACLTGVVLFSGCGSGNGNGVKNKTPKDIATELYGYFAKGDVDNFIDKMYDYMPSETKKDITDETAYKDMLKKEMKKALGKDFQKKLEQYGGELPFEIEEEIDGDKAVVSVKSPDGKTQKMQFVKENGNWKIIS